MNNKVKSLYIQLDRIIAGIDNDALAPLATLIRIEHSLRIRGWCPECKNNGNPCWDAFHNGLGRHHTELTPGRAVENET
jgi:hypothetical protein